MDSIEQMKLLEEKLDKGFDDTWWSKDGFNWKRWKDVSEEEYMQALLVYCQEFWYRGKDNPNEGKIEYKDVEI